MTDIEYKGFGLPKLAEMSLEKPSDFGWWGNDDMFHTWGWAGIDMHRDSSILDQSNFAVITQDLIEKFPDDFKIVGVGHWAVGHADRLTVRVLIDENNGFDESNITDAFKAAIEWLNELDDYPIANEEHYSEMEYLESIEFIMQYLPPFVQRVDGGECEIYSWLVDRGEYISPDAQVYPSEEDLVKAAYWLGYIDRDYQEEWDDACIAYRLPAINWESSIIPAHIQMDGQMSLFDD